MSKNIKQDITKNNFVFLWGKIQFEVFKKPQTVFYPKEIQNRNQLDELKHKTVSIYTNVTKLLTTHGGNLAN